MKLKLAYYSIEFLQMEGVFNDVSSLIREDKENDVLKIL